MADDDRPENLPSGPVGDAIYSAARANGLDPRMLGGIASIESSFQPSSNYNKPTQYKGLFQMGHNEWAQYGNGGNIYDPVDNANAAARMLADHNSWFRGAYGRDPTPGETYMMHQQGRGFFSAGAMTNIGGNPYPGMSGPQDHNSFMSGWGRELARRMNTEYSGEAPYVGAFGGAHAGSFGGGAPSAIGQLESAQANQPDEIDELLKLIPTKKDDEQQLAPAPPIKPLALRLRNAMAGQQAQLPPLLAQRLTGLLRS